MDKPIMPAFPKSWYKHCPKVLEALDWHNRLAPNEEFFEEDHAECAFHNAGFGKECENCNKFLTRPFLSHKVDEEFLPQIEQFYHDMDQYEEDMAVWKAQQPQPITVELSIEEVNFLIDCLEEILRDKDCLFEDLSRNLIGKIQTAKGFEE